MNFWKPFFSLVAGMSIGLLYGHVCNTLIIESYVSSLAPETGKYYIQLYLSSFGINLSLVSSEIKNQILSLTLEKGFFRSLPEVLSLYWDSTRNSVATPEAIDSLALAETEISAETPDLLSTEGLENTSETPPKLAQLSKSTQIVSLLILFGKLAAKALFGG